ncbi:MAG: hypothetical protein NXI12_08870 [Alphaproteobacteria bacterium]|nr:hypothetical protein [Alphaproteobacteria bacterium]
MKLVFRAAAAVVVTPALSVGALLAADQLTPAEGNAAGTPVYGDRQASPSRYDLFSPPSPDEAAAVNAACGFSRSLTGGGHLVRLNGDPVDTVLIDAADDGGAGEDGTLRRFYARADAVHAFAYEGELYIQAGHTDRDGFDGRVWLLNDNGEASFSGPLLSRGRIALPCDDAYSAAELFNDVIASGDDLVADPIRAAVRAFEIGDGVPEWELPRVDALVSACTPDAALADLPSDAPFVLTAEYDADARLGEEIVHDMSGESLAGVAEPMVQVVIADLTDTPDYGYIRNLSIPLSWSFLPQGDGAVSPVFRFEAIETREWLIEANGARLHGMGTGAVSDASIPCADPEAGAAALQALREREIAGG